ncbi:uncharacterized protein LOC144916493 [Branchiostoma floridae x Branchiostoma belcheri]
MDASYQQLLKKHRVELVNNIKDVDSVLDHLVSDGVIEDSEEAEIKDREGVKAQVRKLLVILKDKRGNSFPSFCSALQNGGHKRLADLLRSNDENKAEEKFILRRKSSGSTSNASVSSEEEFSQVDMQKDFDKIIKCASQKWDDLARKLEFNENEIKGIRTDQPDQDHRCREILRRCRNRDGRKATLQVLKQALIEIEERLTAESLDGLKRRKKRERKKKARQPYQEDSSDESNSMGDRSAELQEPQPSTSKRKRKKERLQQSPVKKTRAESDSEDGELHEEGSSSTLFDSSDYEADDPDAEALSRERTVRFKMLKMSKDVFNPDTVADPDKFEEAVGLFREHVGEMLGTDESGSMSEEHKLERKVKLQLRSKARRRKDDVHDAAFTAATLKNLSSYNKVFRCFQEFNAILKGITRGCLLCHLEFEDLSCYRAFLAAYRNGRLSDTLTRELITDDMRAAEGEDLYIHVTLLGEEGGCQDESFSDEGVPLEAEQPSFAPETDDDLATEHTHQYTESHLHTGTEHRMDTEEKSGFRATHGPQTTYRPKTTSRNMGRCWRPTTTTDWSVTSGTATGGALLPWKRSLASRKQNGYFHANAACIMPLFSDFDPREVVVPQSTLENLTQAHVDYCRQYGILLALGSFEVPQR